MAPETGATGGVPGAVRVSVVHADRRVDVVLPASVPLVEYLPEVSRSVGLDGPARWERLGAGGLDPVLGLAGQGVRDGDVVVVLAADGPARLTRFDDLAEAVRVVADEEFPRWRPAWSAAALGVVAAVVTALSALVLPVLGPGPTVVVALPVALAVLLAAGVRSRAGAAGVREEVVAVAVAAPHALVAGLALAPGSASVAHLVGPGRVGAPGWVGAGAALVVLGLLAGVVLQRARWVCAVPVLVGLVWVGCAGVAVLLPVAVGVPVALVATAAVLSGRAAPGAVLEATVVRADRDRSGAVDVDGLRAALRVAHALVACGVLVQGVLVLSAVPYAVGRGLPGTLWAALVVLLLALRCRHEVVRAHVLLQACSAAACWLGVLTAVVVRPDGAPLAAAALLLTAVVAAASRGLSPRASPRLAWLLDGVEWLLVVVLLPGWVVMSGVVPGWSR